MSAFRSWAGRLHWGQLLMVLVGLTLVCCAAGVYSLLEVPAVYRARGDLSQKDFCCDEGLRVGAVTYRFLDSTNLAVFDSTAPEMMARLKAGYVDPLQKYFISEGVDALYLKKSGAERAEDFRKAVLDSARQRVRSFDWSKSGQAGYRSYDIEAFLNIERDYRDERSELESKAGIVALLIGYASGLTSMLALVVFVATLWCWFGARRKIP